MLVACSFSSVSFINKYKIVEIGKFNNQVFCRASERTLGLNEMFTKFAEILLQTCIVSFAVLYI